MARNYKTYRLVFFLQIIFYNNIFVFVFGRYDFVAKTTHDPEFRLHIETRADIGENGQFRFYGRTRARCGT